MNILVTGASGLLGVNVALEAARNHTVFGVVHRRPLKTQAFTVLQVDLRTPGAVERVIEQTQPDWVIHCAALADVEACERDPKTARELNTRLPANLARYVARGGARLLHVSTDAVFDGQKGSYTEDDQPHPLNVYSRTKLAGEQAVLAEDPSAIVARVNLFGWSLTGRRSLAEFFFYNLQAGNPVKGFTDVYFCPLLANDLAQIFLKMLARGVSGIYHVFSSTSISKYNFGVTIARTFGFDEGLITPISVAASGLKAARSPDLTMDVGKLTRSLGEAPPTIAAGMARFAKLYQQGYPQFLKELGSKLTG